MQASAEQRNNQRRTNGEREGTFERYYRFRSLSAYPFKKRLLIRLADLLFYALINVIGFTTRYEIRGWEHYERVEREGFAGIHTLWHDCIYLAIYFWKRRGIVYMTSQSFDGEYIARFLQRFGFGSVRGSSTRGGVGAMIEMARLLRAHIPVGFTVDGPKGPRRVAKMGAVLLAKKTGQPILPFNVTASRFWQAPSWDAFQVPLPFTRALMEIAEPVYVPTDADEATLKARLEELQSKMDELNRRGEEWRA
ncbi:MAG: lysophospholipid acyltransferase family protein [Pyrinomonadaceae bacterium]|nr:lysophospholipid acyltransferase family protein [Pyrinomonadaceae bacterium]